MNRRVFITESQLKRIIKEVSLNGDEELSSNNGNMEAATKKVLNGAKKSGLNVSDGATSVSFSGDALRKNNVAS